MNSRYPLFDFVAASPLPCPFTIDDGVTVTANDIDIDAIHPHVMSKVDRVHVSPTECDYCRIVDESKHDPKVASLFFIVSARLIKASKVFIHYRIDDSGELSRLLDQYPWVVSDETTPLVDCQDLDRLSTIYRGLRTFAAINNRTHNAVYFLGLAYRSIKWAECLIFHVCALETLTSARTRERAVTDNFSRRIHSFTHCSTRDIRRIYDVRSGLVQGRYACNSLRTRNRRDANRAERISRATFAKILCDPNHIKAFRSDKRRVALFGGT